MILYPDYRNTPSPESRLRQNNAYINIEQEFQRARTDCEAKIKLLCGGNLETEFLIEEIIEGALRVENLYAERAYTIGLYDGILLSSQVKTDCP